MDSKPDPSVDFNSSRVLETGESHSMLHNLLIESKHSLVKAVRERDDALSKIEKVSFFEFSSTLVHPTPI